jgi:hypothetical protein
MAEALRPVSIRESARRTPDSRTGLLVAWRRGAVAHSRSGFARYDGQFMVDFTKERGKHEAHYIQTPYISY